jgi:hypothetical protein
MNRRAILIGIIYSLLVISFKIYVVFGGLALTDFGFKYSHIVSVICILPFIVIAIKQCRDKDQAGFIGGREAIKIGMTVTLIAVIVLSIYSYFEFDKWKELSPQYYSSATFHKKYEQYYLNNPGVKKETFENVVQKNISFLNGSQFMTIRLISLLFVGLSTSFIAAVFMKKR